MRAFQILFACAALALVAARPQYGYEQPLGIGIGIGTGSIGGIPSVIGLPLIGGDGDELGQPQPQLPASRRGGDKYLPPASTTPAPIINKKFYLISAPEEHTNEGKTRHLVLGRPQKNFRVVFIKAPSGDNANVKYSAEFAPQEEKTVIYVLSKKDNDLSAGDIATPAPTQPSKPEVFFIKYKTEEEALHAQKEIQGQYDKLGGTNEFQEEKNAPVTSIIGSLDGINPDGSYEYRQINGNGPNVGPGRISQPTTQYLPSALKSIAG